MSFSILCKVPHGHNLNSRLVKVGAVEYAAFIIFKFSVRFKYLYTYLLTMRNTGKNRFISFWKDFLLLYSLLH